MKASQLPREALAELIARCFGEVGLLTAEDLDGHVASWDLQLGQSQVVRRGGRAVAVGCLGVRRPDGWLAFIGVIPECRGQGWGRVVCQRLIERGRKLGLRRLRLEVLQDNEPALALYRRLGFETRAGLEIWEHPGLARPLREFTPWQLLPVAVQALVPENTPWQRQPAPWLPTVFNDEACILLGNPLSLSIRQMLGPVSALRPLLKDLGCGWRFNNLEAGHPLGELLREFGAQVTRRQWDMTLEL